MTVNSVIDFKISNYYFRFRSPCETCSKEINSPEHAEGGGGGSRSFFPGLERVWRAEVGSGTVMGFAPLFSKFNPLKKQAMLAFSMGEMPCFSCRQWLPGQRVASRNTDITQDAAFHGPLETKESIS